MYLYLHLQTVLKTMFYRNFFKLEFNFRDLLTTDIPFKHL